MALEHPVGDRVVVGHRAPGRLLGLGGRAGGQRARPRRARPSSEPSRRALGLDRVVVGRAELGQPAHHRQRSRGSRATPASVRPVEPASAAAASASRLVAARPRVSAIATCSSASAAEAGRGRRRPRRSSARRPRRRRGTRSGSTGPSGAAEHRARRARRAARRAGAAATRSRNAVGGEVAGRAPGRTRSPTAPPGPGRPRASDEAVADRRPGPLVEPHPRERLAVRVGHHDRAGPVVAARTGSSPRSTSRVPTSASAVVVRRHAEAVRPRRPRGPAPARRRRASTRMVSKPVVRSQTSAQPRTSRSASRVERVDEVGERGVAEPVPGQVGVHAGQEGLVAEPGDQLAQHRVALGVGDRVEVGRAPRRRRARPRRSGATGWVERRSSATYAAGLRPIS